ncbi:hypothetical protein ACTFIU_004815 [Dictyostelium citrinum]
MAQQIRRQQPTDREYYAISYDIATPHERGGTAYHLPADHVDKNHQTNWFYEKLRGTLVKKYHFERVQKSMYKKECSLAYAMDVAYTLPNGPVENQDIDQEIEQDLNNAIQQMNINNDQVNN